MLASDGSSGRLTVDGHRATGGAADRDEALSDPTTLMLPRPSISWALRQPAAEHRRAGFLKSQVTAPASHQRASAADDPPIVMEV
jgi:hypothetical protein